MALLWSITGFLALGLILAGVWAPINSVVGASSWRFLGRFHVLILHFPIVLILMAPALDLLSRAHRLATLKLLSPYVWATAALSAIMAASLGLMLAASEGYSAEAVYHHRIAGVSVAVLACLLTALRINLVVYPKKWLFTIHGLAAGTLVILMFFAAHAGGNLVRGEDYLVAHAPVLLQKLTGYEDPAANLPWSAKDHPIFTAEVQPLLQTYCSSCHGPDIQKGNMRLDILNPDMVQGVDAQKWHEVLNALNAGEMPPKEKPQPNLIQREKLVGWLTENLEIAALAKKDETPAAMLRRLTKAQYTNTLQDLLGLDINFGQPLPNDGKSGMGFDNNATVLQTSPLHLDYYQDIARNALDQALSIGEQVKPLRVRVTFGQDIDTKLAGALTGGFQSKPLNLAHFSIDFLDQNGMPITPTTEAEVTAQRQLKAGISIGQRGSALNRYRMVPEGMLLYSALPHTELPPASWQGPSPNLMLQLQRIAPKQGNFELRVNASIGYFPKEKRESLLLLGNKSPLVTFNDETQALQAGNKEAILIAAQQAVETNKLVWQGDALVPEDVTAMDHFAAFDIKVANEGIYQIDLIYPAVSEGAMPSARVDLGKGISIENALDLNKKQSSKTQHSTYIGTAYLQSGERQVKVGGRFFAGIQHLVLTPIPMEKIGQQALARLGLGINTTDKSADGKLPSIRSFVGTRTDDGMDYAEFDAPQTVTAGFGDAETYVFRGRLENLPLPQTSDADTDQLGGIMLLGLWNHHLVKEAGQSGPPLLVKSMEFEAPFNPQWPKASHQAIFIDSPQKNDEQAYTKEVLTNFLNRAFRRPVETTEVARYMNFWESLRNEYDIYEESVKEVLVAILASPNFLFMTPAAEDDMSQPDSQASFALASRLSYFLWNSPPDEILVEAAHNGSLEKNLNSEVARMFKDDRIWRFLKPFSEQWLRLDRHKSMTVDPRTYPTFTRFVKQDMEQETYHFIRKVLVDDMSIMTLIDSDFAMLNQNLAEFYGIEGIEGHGFRPVPLPQNQPRGGLLSQGAFLAGHSDGVDSHPIKRAVWILEKILGDHPPAPPPNVPDLDPDTPGFDLLTLKEQLALHRDKDSCRSCHQKIDPYGLVFESYNAAGLWRTEAKGRPVDAESVLPSGVKLNGVADLKHYILTDRRDDFARSVIKHLYAYALGRDIQFSDTAAIDAILAQVKAENYRAQSFIEAIVLSDGFVRG